RIASAAAPPWSSLRSYAWIARPRARRSSARIVPTSPYPMRAMRQSCGEAGVGMARSVDVAQALGGQLLAHLVDVEAQLAARQQLALGRFVVLAYPCRLGDLAGDAAWHHHHPVGIGDDD